MAAEETVASLSSASSGYVADCLPDTSAPLVGPHKRYCCNWLLDESSTHCNKSFDRKSDLKRHQCIHSGRKDYKCHDCGKAFVQSSALHVHERTHTGVKPHECGQCPKAFSDSSSLARHRRTHDPNRTSPRRSKRKKQQQPLLPGVAEHGTDGTDFFVHDEHADEMELGGPDFDVVEAVPTSLPLGIHTFSTAASDTPIVSPTALRMHIPSQSPEEGPSSFVSALSEQSAMSFVSDSGDSMPQQSAAMYAYNGAYSTSIPQGHRANVSLDMPTRRVPGSVPSRSMSVADYYQFSQAANEEESRANARRSLPLMGATQAMQLPTTGVPGWVPLTSQLHASAFSHSASPSVSSCISDNIFPITPKFGTTAGFDPLQPLSPEGLMPSHADQSLGNPEHQDMLQQAYDMTAGPSGDHLVRSRGLPMQQRGGMGVNVSQVHEGPIASRQPAGPYEMLDHAQAFVSCHGHGEPQLQLVRGTSASGIQQEMFNGPAPSQNMMSCQDLSGSSRVRHDSNGDHWAFSSNGLNLAYEGKMNEAFGDPLPSTVLMH